MKKFQNELILLLKKSPVKHASLSDEDVLIAPNKGFTLFDMLRIEHTIEEKLNRKINIVEFSTIKSSVREKVLEEAVTLF